MMGGGGGQRHARPTTTKKGEVVGEWEVESGKRERGEGGRGGAPGGGRCLPTLYTASKSKCLNDAHWFSGFWFLLAYLPWYRTQDSVGQRLPLILMHLDLDMDMDT